MRGEKEFFHRHSTLALQVHAAAFRAFGHGVSADHQGIAGGVEAALPAAVGADEGEGGGADGHGWFSLAGGGVLKCPW